MSVIKIKHSIEFTQYSVYRINITFNKIFKLCSIGYQLKQPNKWLRNLYD